VSTSEPAVLVREAGPGDLDALVRFNMAMALETEGLQPDPEVMRAGVSAALGDPSRGRYFVVERGGVVAGGLLVTTEWSDWRNATFWWIQSVFVEPGHRGAGLFAALYLHVKALAAAAGSCGLRLYVHADNDRARSVYERLGMVDSGYRVLETPDALKR
jgi:GNAT superfamily N-acetyltransferase